jgi:hypothetical protein
MLIYARRSAVSPTSRSDGCRRGSTPDPIALQVDSAELTLLNKPSSDQPKPPEPPSHALEEVDRLNREHERACNEHRSK